MDYVTKQYIHKPVMFSMFASVSGNISLLSCQVISTKVQKSLRVIYKISALTIKF